MSDLFSMRRASLTVEEEHILTVVSPKFTWIISIEINAEDDPDQIRQCPSGIISAWEGQVIWCDSEYLIEVDIAQEEHEIEIEIERKLWRIIRRTMIRIDLSRPHPRLQFDPIHFHWFDLNWLL